MSCKNSSSFSDVAVNGQRPFYKTQGGVKVLVCGMAKLGSLIGTKEIQTNTIMYEDSIIQWSDGLKRIRADKKTRQWEYCQNYDKSIKNKCDCYKMAWHGKENGKVCNHIVKRCNSVIRKPTPQAKSWNGSNTWQLPTKQAKKSITEQVETIQQDKGLRWREILND